MRWYNACKTIIGTLDHTVFQLQWKAPRPDACKVNTYGSKINATGLSGAGGLLQDAIGAWIQGFIVNLGASTILEIHEHWCCAIKHIYCEQNVAIDALAARSYNLGPGLHVYDEMPDFFEDILATDAKGILRPRAVIL
ncbi:hypothetical protein L3X38_018809 [Prunus dulcis]|uniref:RNase H type-1 domain-containing protein n=1 Tax=Prunus dulcis TaxID=3755 RepID=A0AAD4WBY8_PRUDU|nr:hypothetical protein L3X38_018809 [Prunus dulcis]